MVFVWLWLCMTVGILLHELAHHLTFRPSEMALTRFFPLAPVTEANRVQLALAELAGPSLNMTLGLACFAGFAQWGGAWLYPAAANLTLVVVPAVVNLVVDLVNRKPSNDLQKAGALLGLPLVALPALFMSLAGPPLWYLALRLADLWSSFVLLFGSFALAGLVLAALEKLFRVRFRLV